jgi:TM2 domain-containing membrane protein YozV
MIQSKGITLLLAFFSITGMFGIDKFYNGNYILGSIQSILSLSYIGYIISLLLNMTTIILLLLTIFTNINFAFYVNWEHPTTNFDYAIAIVVTLYMIIKHTILYKQEKIENNIENNMYYNNIQ